jgi:type I restriction enzyme M protein
MLASLKPTGRMGVVLDQGALFRGGAEGKIRQKVVEDDLVECVVALPEKIFYNTGAPGCLIFLNKNKPREKKGKVLFVYAAKGFEKLKNMNRLRDQDIEKTLQTYRKFKDVPKHAGTVSIEKIRENDYNLSVTRYVDVFEEDEPIDVSQVWSGLKALESERQDIEDKLSAYLRELGYER